uniref:Uncharacterized protein n=1 Tax=Anguilla anguilla TaxID=7936 RepID=A0A0E9PIJ0_ANGAN
MPPDQNLLRWLPATNGRTDTYCSMKVSIASRSHPLINSSVSVGSY